MKDISRKSNDTREINGVTYSIGDLVYGRFYDTVKDCTILIGYIEKFASKFGSSLYTAIIKLKMYINPSDARPPLTLFKDDLYSIGNSTIGKIPADIPKEKWVEYAESMCAITRR